MVHGQEPVDLTGILVKVIDCKGFRHGDYHDCVCDLKKEGRAVKVERRLATALPAKWELLEGPFSLVGMKKIVVRSEVKIAVAKGTDLAIAA